MIVYSETWKSPRDKRRSVISRINSFFVYPRNKLSLISLLYSSPNVFTNPVINSFVSSLVNLASGWVGK